MIGEFNLSGISATLDVLTNGASLRKFLYHCQGSSAFHDMKLKVFLRSRYVLPISSQGPGLGLSPDEGAPVSLYMQYLWQKQCRHQRKSSALERQLLGPS